MILCLPVIFDTLILMYQYRSLSIFLVGVLRASWICMPISVLTFGEFSPIIFQINSLPNHFFLFLCLSLVTFMFFCLISFLTYLHFSLFFFLLLLDLIILTVWSLSLLILSSAWSSLFHSFYLFVDILLLFIYHLIYLVVFLFSLFILEHSYNGYFEIFAL